MYYIYNCALRNRTNSFCLRLKNRKVSHQIVDPLLLLLDDVHETLEIRLALVQLLAHQGVVLKLALYEVRVLFLVLFELLRKIVVALAGLLAGYQCANTFIRVQKLEPERLVFFSQLRVLLQKLLHARGFIVPLQINYLSLRGIVVLAPECLCQAQGLRLRGRLRAV